ncbi:hypothetical protein T459_01112 [Capsicum annuum]|uniref:Uncharacterized protein n=1 Tax=Capsicum annuum TaxID=4072 RepID=A0A2G3AG94_CAPAN|nr:hypothetical protein FXO37_28232 [Capsicum annuum]PHT93230.1 hypothetical protein T459_01112 [Capsicum annuum]
MLTSSSFTATTAVNNVDNARKTNQNHLFLLNSLIAIWYQSLEALFITTKRANVVVPYSLANYISYDHLPSRFQACIAASSADTEPSSYKEAVTDSRWVEAMKAQIDALESNHTWELVTLPEGKKPIGCKWGEKESEGVEPDRMEFYKHIHCTSEKGWSSEEAETNYNNMNDLKALYTSGESSMTIDEIVDAVLGTKLGYIKCLGYGPKLNTTTATQRKTTELEDSLKKAKFEAAIAQNEFQK